MKPNRSKAKPRKIAKATPKVRLPQRSEAVSGDEEKGMTPIAAAQTKETKQKIAAALPKPTMMERAQELSESGDYAYVYQIERKLIEEGYGSASGFKAGDRVKLRASLRTAKS